MRSTNPRSTTGASSFSMRTTSPARGTGASAVRQMGSSYSTPPKQSRFSSNPVSPGMMQRTVSKPVLSASDLAEITSPNKSRLESNRPTALASTPSPVKPDTDQNSPNKGSPSVNTNKEPSPPSSPPKSPNGRTPTVTAGASSTTFSRSNTSVTSTTPKSSYGTWDSTRFKQQADTPSPRNFMNTTSHSPNSSKFLIGPPKDPLASGKTISTADDDEDDSKRQQKELYTIVWDLDETLVSNRGPGQAIMRSGAIETLKALHALNNEHRIVEQVLWTASVESLARVVLLRLDPGNKYFQHHIFRDKRWFRETGYTKDLRLLGRDMNRTMIVENSPLSVTLNREHSLLVKDFMGHTQDQELRAVREVLEGWVQDSEKRGFVPYAQQHSRVSRTNNIISSGIQPTSLSGIMGTASSNRSSSTPKRTGLGGASTSWMSRQPTTNYVSPYGRRF